MDEGAIFPPESLLSDFISQSDPITKRFAPKRRHVFSSFENENFQKYFKAQNTKLFALFPNVLY